MKKLIEFTLSHITVFGLSIFVFLTFLVLGKEIGDVFKYWVKVIGPTLYILLPMAGLLVSIILLIVLDKMNERFPSIRELQLIEEGAPVLGLLGTVVALVRGFGRLDLKGSIDTSIADIISIINESLLSTAIGLGIGLLAWFVRKRFVPGHLLDKDAKRQSTSYIDNELIK